MQQELEQNLALDQENHKKEVITVVLTADNHLGQHSRKREERRQRLRQAFQRATDFAIGQGVDLFIQAGDLFDTPAPDEQDRSFVAARLSAMRQAGIRIFALGGVHDTPANTSSLTREGIQAPQMSYARLGALHYFAPRVDKTQELEPVLVDIQGIVIAICGLGVLAGQEGDPLAGLHVQNDIERAAISLLILHAPIEGMTTGSSLLDTRAQVSRASIAAQPYFHSILAGYHHSYSRSHIGSSDVVVAGATQHIDFSDPGDDPGFVFLGLASDGIRWCEHISVDTLILKRLVVHSSELWLAETQDDPTEIILERLRPLCAANTMVQLRLEGELTRQHYHQLDLNSIRRYGETHCFALAIDDSALTLLPVEHLPLPGENTVPGETAADLDDRKGLAALPSATGGSGSTQGVLRFSPREELIAVVDEEIAACSDEQEKRALRTTKEELLLALDEMKSGINPSRQRR